jgi:hypothetical protein
VDSVLMSEFRTALRQHRGTVVACCRDQELTLWGTGFVTKLKAMQRSSAAYAFSLQVKETLERLGEEVFFRFEPRDNLVLVENSTIQFEKTVLPERPPKLECKAVVRGEDLAEFSEVQFVGKQVIFALEQTPEGTALVVTDSYALHHVVLSISSGSGNFVSRTLPTFGVFKRGAVEVLANETHLALKQGGLELHLARDGTLPDYKKVLNSLKIYEQFTVPAEPLHDHLEKLKRDKTKQVVVTMKNDGLELEGNFVCRIQSNKSLTLTVLARLLYDALPQQGEVDLLLTGNNTPFIVHSHKRWTMLVPIPAKEVVRGTGANLLEVLEPSPELAQAA